MTACKKDSTPASLEGKWEIMAFTPAPADLVLDWQQDYSKTTIEFKNGIYSHSSSPGNGRYIFKDNVIYQFSDNSRDTLKLAVTELTLTTLQYHVLNGRAPVKSKFKRIK